MSNYNMMRYVSHGCDRNNEPDLPSDNNCIVNLSKNRQHKPRTDF